MRAMALHLNERDLMYDKLRDTFDKCNAKETSFHDHLVSPGKLGGKIWLHYKEK